MKPFLAAVLAYELAMRRERRAAGRSHSNSLPSFSTRTTIRRLAKAFFFRKKKEGKKKRGEKALKSLET